MMIFFIIILCVIAGLILYQLIRIEDALFKIHLDGVMILSAIEIATQEIRRK